MYSIQISNVIDTNSFIIFLCMGNKCSYLSRSGESRADIITFFHSRREAIAVLKKYFKVRKFAEDQYWGEYLKSIINDRK